jgi:hypothetical protein
MEAKQQRTNSRDEEDVDKVRREILEDAHADLSFGRQASAEQRWSRCQDASLQTGLQERSLAG